MKWLNIINPEEICMFAWQHLSDCSYTINTCQSLYHNHIFVFIYFIWAVPIASILNYNTVIIPSTYPAPPSINNTFKSTDIDIVKGERSPFKIITNEQKTSSEITARAPVTDLHSLSRETMSIFQDKMSVSWLTCMRSPTSSISLTIFQSLSSSSSSSCSCVAEYEWNLFSKPDISPMALLLCVSATAGKSLVFLLDRKSSNSRQISACEWTWRHVRGRVSDVKRPFMEKDWVNIVLLYNFVYKYNLVNIFTFVHSQWFS